MRCLNCDVENKADASYCRICGSRINKCSSCDAPIEDDARFCRRCGEHLNTNVSARPSAEGAGYAAPNSPPPPPASKCDSDVDFTTKVTPKKVVPIREARRARRLSRLALYTAAALALAVVVAAVIVMGAGVLGLWPQGESLALPTNADAIEAGEQMIADNKRKAEEEKRNAAAQSLIAADLRRKNEEVSRKVSKEESRLAGIKEEIARLEPRHTELVAKVGLLEARVGRLTVEAARVRRGRDVARSQLEKARGDLKRVKAEETAVNGRLRQKRAELARVNGKANGFRRGATAQRMGGERARPTPKANIQSRSRREERAFVRRPRARLFGSYNGNETGQ